MREETTRSRNKTRKIAGVVATLGLGLLLAAPAQARDEFENAFEDTMGRLLAYEAVSLGRFVLGSAFYGQPVAYAAPAPVAIPVPLPVYSYDIYEPRYTYAPQRGHHKHHAKHHRKHWKHQHCTHGSHGGRRGHRGY